MKSSFLAGHKMVDGIAQYGGFSVLSFQHEALALSKEGLLYAGDDHGNLVEWEPNFKLKARFSKKLDDWVLFSEEKK